MKKLFSLIIITIALNGCIFRPDTNNNQPYHNNDNSVVYGSSFNEEHYIWENWSFTTNRVVQPR